jgi:Ser/Thr protein kinase RdoA (MazF antagonist)
MTPTVLPLDLSLREIGHLASTLYGVNALAVHRLDSELSAVARLDLESGPVVFKAVRFSEADAEIARWRAGAVERLGELGVPVGRNFHNRAGELVSVAEAGSGTVIVQLSEWLAGVPLESVAPSRALLVSVGRTAATVARGLVSWPAPPARVEHVWEMVRTTATLREATASVPDAFTRELVESAARRFGEVVDPVLDALPRAVIHHDLHDSNLLVNAETESVSGVLDFGDMVEGPRVAELAVAAAYASRNTEDPVRAFLCVAEGWGRTVGLTDLEIGVVFDAALGRLAVNAAVWSSRRFGARRSYALARSGASARTLARLLQADRGRMGAELRDRLG